MPEIKVSKLKRFLEFMSLLTVEPYIFLFMFVLQLREVTTRQLIQDKICLFEFKLSANYCSAVPTMAKEDDYLGMKSDILSKVSMFVIYLMVLVTVPSFIAGMFVGSWTDKYLNGKRLIMIGGSLSGLSEAVFVLLNIYFFDSSQYLLLLAYVPSVFAGGILAVLASYWSYIATATPSNMRALRMTLVGIIIAIANTLGSYLGGIILNTKSMFNNGQLYNYEAVFLTSGISFILCLFWTIFIINEKRDIQEFDKRFNDNSNYDEINERLKRYEQFESTHPIRLLFDFNNFKDVVKTCFKRRSDNIRLQIWLMFLCLLLTMMASLAETTIGFQFVQKVYSWNSETFSTAISIGKFSSNFLTLIITPILIKVLKMEDLTLGLVGIVADFAQNLFRGLILSPIGFYLSLVPGSLESLSGIGMRAYFSDIVAPNELGKVFTLISTLNTVMPLLSAGVFTTLFNATIDSMVGLVYIVTAVIILIAFICVLWIRINGTKPNNSELASTNIEDKHQASV